MSAAEIGDLVEAWGGVQDDYQSRRDAAKDRIVLECARALAADPGGERAHQWTLGLVMMLPYVGWLPGDGVPGAVFEAVRAADGALGGRPCPHAVHPYAEDELEDHLFWLRDLLPDLVDESAEWDEDERPRDEWLCPRNVAGFARIAMDFIEPGSAAGVPPRLPEDTRRDIESLSAVLHGCPRPGTDVDSEISRVGDALGRAADPDDRAGLVIATAAVSWYAISDMMRSESVLDDLAAGLETALTRLSDARCAHDGHPGLPGSGPDAVWVGLHLSSPAGRRVYEAERGSSGWGAPQEALLCPVFTAATARETLARLRERREALFGAEPPVDGADSPVDGAEPPGNRDNPES
ncbi:hypothetical protein [Streptomyces longisporoflavus]|uniref:Uncharacterized protein n=1 Tax=Streptomyces longisporoflavus TaxID=28044 RepID=A0ABW7QXV5_9ACTN